MHSSFESYSFFGHLQKHVVGGATLYSPGDIEGHAGLDGRMYLIDLARLFPPEFPDGTCLPDMCSVAVETSEPKSRSHSSHQRFTINLPVCALADLVPRSFVQGQRHLVQAVTV